MRVPRTKAVVAWFRLLRAALRPGPGSLTLDQLRSELSHETSAKLARLSGLAREWTRGRMAPDDPATVVALAADLERVLLRQARLACARLRTSITAAELLARASVLRTTAREWRLRPPGPADAAARLSATVDAYRRESQALVEALCARFGMRLGDLLIAAAGEVAHEYEGRAEGAVSIAFEGEPRALGLWVPLADAAPWTDLLRNLIRNATQATLDRWNGDAQPRPDPPPVAVRVRAPGESPEALIEIADEGVGMDAAQADAMWRAGHSTHGEHRGQGLTEGKRSWLAERARLDVRSAPRAGTCVRLELPPRDVVLRLPRVWQLRPVAWPSTAVAVVMVTALPALLGGGREGYSIEAHHRVALRDERGHLVWRRDMGEQVDPNWWGEALQRGEHPGDIDEPLQLSSAEGTRPDVVVATHSDSGTGHLWRLTEGGRVAWSHALSWIEPPGMDTLLSRQLRCVFQVPTAWAADPAGAIAANVRMSDWSPTSIQFFTPGGDSLGAYYHPGHLSPCTTLDLDGDDRRELMLYGVNNSAPGDTAFLPAAPDESTYVGCLVLLASPGVDGQAYPYRRWPNLPQAREKAYLLVPPLRPHMGSEVTRIRFGAASPGRPARMEMYVQDGRIYALDRLMRPIACAVGDRTPAARLGPTRPMAPLLYIHEGTVERIDLPLRGGSR